MRVSGAPWLLRSLVMVSLPPRPSISLRPSGLPAMPLSPTNPAVLMVSAKSAPTMDSTLTSVSSPTAGHGAGREVDGDTGGRVGVDGAVEALAAVEDVVAGETLQPVVAGKALDGVVAGGAGERVGAGGADHEGAAVDGDRDDLVEGQAAGIGGAHRDLLGSGRQRAGDDQVAAADGELAAGVVEEREGGGVAGVRIGADRAPTTVPTAVPLRNGGVGQRDVGRGLVDVGGSDREASSS